MSRGERHSVRPVARYAAVILHDMLCAAFSYWFAGALILPLHQFSADLNVILPLAMIASVLSALISQGFGVFSTRWRLASLTDFVALIKSAACLTITLLAARYMLHLLFPEPFFIAEVRIICLGGIFVLGSQAGGRICYRYYRFLRRRKRSGGATDTTIFVGSIAEAESALRGVEQGMLKANIVACLLPRGSRLSKEVRGRPILGTTDDLEYAVEVLAAGGLTPSFLLLSRGILSKRDEAQHLKRAGRRFGMTLLKVETVGLGGRTEVRLEDFLFRSTRRIDHRAIEGFVKGRTILITGGGGTIGGDIAVRAAAHGARQIILLDISELGLQTRLSQLRHEFPSSESRVVICDVRDRERLTAVVAEARPEVLVHAAALKHVDLVEQNWQEAVRTNVLGTLNVLAAADHADVATFVNISTDKAADPVGMLGFTKRASEILVAARALTSGGRRLSVRFGNVLGSSGSVVEVFLAQIAAGGPVTLTDANVKRYFMSRREAAELVLAAGSLLDSAPLYILDMGEPIAIRDLAIELIEWAGFQPETEIQLVTTGLRPGERVEEVLTSKGEVLVGTAIEGVRAVRHSLAAGQHGIDVDALVAALTSDDKAGAVRALQPTGLFPPVSTAAEA